jgi:predicted cobalt transporter CbtA
MVGTLLIRGMLAGLVAGFLVFGFSKTFGEPQVDRAIAFETAMDEANADASAGMAMPQDEPVLVSRAVQAGVGLLTGVVVYCTAIGGLFALVFACAYGRVGRLSPRVVSVLLGAGGLIAIYLVPSLKYPASPPSVGEPETIGYRTALYFGMIVISVAAMVGAIIMQRRLVARHGTWAATLMAVGVYVVAIAAASLLLPTVNEVPDGFPANVLWQFRIAALGMQVIMWAAIGLVFGALTQRAMTGGRRGQWTDYRTAALR